MFIGPLHKATNWPTLISIYCVFCVYLSVLCHTTDTDMVHGPNSINVQSGLVFVCNFLYMKRWNPAKGKTMPHFSVPFIPAKKSVTMRNESLHVLQGPVVPKDWKWYSQRIRLN